MNRINRVRLTKNFSLHEFESPDTKEVMLYNGLVVKLQHVRDQLKKPIKISSGYRTEKHNEYVGGKEKSQHRIGAAVDITTKNHDPFLLKTYLKQAGFEQVIYYKKQNFIHAALFIKNPFDKTNRRK